jgi:hypothetical protein
VLFTQPHPTGGRASRTMALPLHEILLYVKHLQRRLRQQEDKYYFIKGLQCSATIAELTRTWLCGTGMCWYTPCESSAQRDVTAALSYGV